MKRQELFCTAGHTYLLSVFLCVGRLYIVLDIVLLLQCGAENPLLKDGNMFSFLNTDGLLLPPQFLK